MFNKLVEYFKEQNFHYSIVENKTIATLGIRTDKANYQCVADINEDVSIFIFYAVFGIVVPIEKRTYLAEVLTKINYGLRIGNFEMDFEDGEIRYKTSIDYEGGELISKFIENIINSTINNSDAFFAEIMDAIIINK